MIRVLESIEIRLSARGDQTLDAYKPHTIVVNAVTPPVSEVSVVGMGRG
jgi:hypothetical protein